MNKTDHDKIATNFFEMINPMYNLFTDKEGSMSSRENKIVIVHGSCSLCPFSGEADYCQFPEGDCIELDYSKLPPNCPLRKQGIEIKLDF
ncbi:MAG: hypothetical protein KKC03_13860 [Bacteroidetes bacterium]|nr:hypothetical protein [Bacteroidota bacterium]